MYLQLISNARFAVAFYKKKKKREEELNYAKQEAEKTGYLEGIGSVGEPEIFY